MKNSELFHVAIVGLPNVGKSTLMNALTNQKVSITSDFPGTTSDVVKKRMELLGVGPIMLLDTAGLNDESKVSADRDQATQLAVDQASLILWIQDASQPVLTKYPFINDKQVPVCKVFSKCDCLTKEQLDKLKQQFDQTCFIGHYDADELSSITDKIKHYYYEKDINIISKLVASQSFIVFVTPIDSAAPKNRLILPQARLLQEALVHQCIAIHCQVETLETTLKKIKQCDLVICDSQCVNEVLQVVDKEIPLTTFSIIECYRKGDFKYFVESLDAIKELKDYSKILICEACTHTVSHEDIGQIKIPKLLHKINETFEVDFATNINFRDPLDYDFIIHCGGCMINKELMMTRINLTKGAGIKMTNYGLFLAYNHGGLERCINIFKKNLLM